MKKLEQFDSFNRRNQEEISVGFREYFMSFKSRLESETTFQIKEVVMSNGSNSRKKQDKDIINIKCKDASFTGS